MATTEEYLALELPPTRTYRITPGGIVGGVNIIREHTDFLNALSKRGWELVTIDNGVAYFKR
jgi:hypothetical protein